MIISAFMSNRDPEKLFPHDYLMKYVINLVPDFIKPNHFTIARMVLTPFVLWLLLIESYHFGVPAFILVAFTDTIDGSLARWRKQVTNWGAFYDPIADKMLIGSVVVLILIQHVNSIIAIGVILLEVLMVLGGWYKRQRGTVLHANVWGKVKMLLQFLGVLFLLMSLWLGIDLFVDISEGTLILAIIFAIIALLTYSL